ncbi:MAG: aminotransferase class V-fold PLP-dependent enzyme [Victivallales bacterium]|nr:aminotransferase class V-fold PLP-dependent enzyme [Victivallales bacterium]
MIYLDYAGSGLPLPEVISQYPQYCAKYSLNPHGGTRQAEEARRAILAAERRLLKSMGIPEDEAEVVWTSGGTEALNLAIFGLQPANPSEWFVDSTAHHAMIEPAKIRTGKTGVPLVRLMTKRTGELELPPSSSPAVICICQLNNETGAIQDLPAIRRNIGSNPLMIVDACQSFCRIPLEWTKARIDMAIVSSRKIGGPASSGALVIRKGLRLSPMLFGGRQQHGLRPGTMDTVNILLFADAAEHIANENAIEYEKRLESLNSLLVNGLNELKLPKHTMISQKGRSHPAICMFSLPGYEGAVIKRILADKHDIIIGTGSACSAEAGEPSHVLTAMGFDEKTIRGALRVSFSPTQTESHHITAFLETLKQTLDNY